MYTAEQASNLPCFVSTSPARRFWAFSATEKLALTASRRTRRSHCRPHNASLDRAPLRNLGPRTCTRTLPTLCCSRFPNRKKVPLLFQLTSPPCKHFNKKSRVLSRIYYCLLLLSDKWAVMELLFSPFFGFFFLSLID